MKFFCSIVLLLLSVCSQAQTTRYTSADSFFVYNNRLGSDSNAYFVLKGKTGNVGIFPSKRGTNCTVLKFDAPGLAGTELPFEMRYHVSVNADGTANTPMQIGFNTDGSRDPLQPGIGFSMEPRFISGGVHNLELILNGHLANGEDVRLLMATFEARDSLGNSVNRWDLRGGLFSLYDLKNRNYFSAAGNALGTTVGIKDIATGYGLEIKTDAMSPGVYFDGVGAGGVDVRYRNVKRFIFGDSSAATFYNLTDPSATPYTWGNFKASGNVDIVRAASEWGLYLKGSTTNNNAWFKANNNTAVAELGVPNGGYELAFAAGTERARITATGQLGIGTSTPDASAKVQITSTTQGLLVPRMTQAQRDAIVSPADGLLIFQTDNLRGLYWFDGTGAGWTK